MGPRDAVSSRVGSLVTQAKLWLEHARADHAFIDVAVRTFTRFSEDDGASYAAALTYFTFLSIFPLLAFALAALGFVTFGNEELQRDIFKAGVDAAPLLRDALTPEGLEIVESNRRRLAVTGVALALYSGSGAVVALEHALNRIFHVADEPSFVHKRLRSLKWLSILGAAAAASLALSAAARFSTEIFGSFGPVDEAMAALFYAAGVLVGVGIFATAFKVLPVTELRWREVLPGAVLAAALFEVLKIGGATYLAAGARGRQATFGAFAAAAGLLVAAYLASQITLRCAEVNAVLAERRETRHSQVSESQGGSR
ncbi:inner membrane protein YhjD [soil metagenome]